MQESRTPFTVTDRVKQRRRPQTAGKTTQVKQSDTGQQYGEESYDFPNDTMTETGKGRSDHVNENDIGLHPD